MANGAWRLVNWRFRPEGQKRSDELIMFKRGQSQIERFAKMRTAIGVQERPQSALIECQFVRTVDRHAGLWELAFLLTILRNA